MTSLYKFGDAFTSVTSAMSKFGWSKGDSSPTLPTQVLEPPRSGCQSPINTGTIGWPEKRTSFARPLTQTGLQTTLQLPTWNTPPKEDSPAQGQCGWLSTYQSIRRGQHAFEDTERGPETADSMTAKTRKPGSDEAERLLEEGLYTVKGL
jgi:hypothetical protein